MNVRPVWSWLYEEIHNDFIAWWQQGNSYKMIFPKKLHFITKTRLFKYIEIFTTKNWKFSDKNSDIIHISAQNIDCGYLVEAVLTSTHNLCFEQK